MADEATQAVVLRDGQGNLYVIDRKLIEGARVPEDQRQQIEAEIQHDVAGFAPQSLSTLGVINIGTPAVSQNIQRFLDLQAQRAALRMLLHSLD